MSPLVLAVLAAVLALAALVVFGRGPAVQVAPHHRQLAELLDLLDHRYRTCATLRLVGDLVTAQLRGMSPQVRLACDSAADALDVTNVALRLPSAPLYASVTNAVELLRIFVNRVAKDVCVNGAVHPHRLADAIAASVGAMCDSAAFRSAYPPV